MRILRFLAALLLLASPLCAASWYVSPTGTSSSPGTLAQPWDAATGLSSPSVQPGDTLYLRGGTYKNSYPGVSTGNPIPVWQISLVGTPAAPITVRPYPGERVILDGTQLGQPIRNKVALYHTGAYVTLRDIEITNSDPTGRDSQYRYCCDLDDTTNRGIGIQANGPGLRVINSVIHDTGNGLLKSAETSPDFLMYGCVVYNNGIETLDNGGIGHGLYVQNRYTEALFAENFVLHNFNFQIHQYGSAASWSDFFTWRGNVLATGNNLIGGGAPVRNLLFESNFLFGRSDQGYGARAGLSFGYGAWDNGDAAIINNQLYGNVSIPRAFDNLTFVGNNVGGNGADQVELALFTTDTSTTEITSNLNHYYVRDFGQWFAHDTRAGGHDLLNFAEWQGLGWDLSSTYHPDPADLRGTQVFVRPNAYDSRRANIIIYNWDELASVPVSIAGLGITKNSTYTLTPVQNYNVDRVSGTYRNGGVINVPMLGYGVALPVGYPTVRGPSTFPRFGAFVLTWTPRGMG